MFKLASRHALRRRKLVRVHVQNGPSVEGVYAGRQAGQYVLELATLLEGKAATVALEGTVLVPAHTVIFMQVLADGIG